MATSHSTPAKISFEEYLELEERANFRSEYRSGEVFAMAGGSILHGQLKQRAGRLLEDLYPRCVVIESDLKVFAEAVNEAMYPDVVVFCGEPQLYRGLNNVITNPSVIVEVLSPSTREYDLSLKASFYRSISSVSDIIFIDTQRRWIQRQSRQGFHWKLEELTHSDQVVLSVIDQPAITVSDIYRGIELD